MKDTSWGGEIELMIFANHYKTQICAINIQNLKKYLYGESFKVNFKINLELKFINIII